MSKKAGIIFFVLGALALITGLVLIFSFNKTPAIGLVALGVMWMPMAVVQVKIDKEKATTAARR